MQTIPLLRVGQYCHWCVLKHHLEKNSILSFPWLFVINWSRSSPIFFLLGYLLYLAFVVACAYQSYRHNESVLQHRPCLLFLRDAVVTFCEWKEATDPTYYTIIAMVAQFVTDPWEMRKEHQPKGLASSRLSFALIFRVSCVIGSHSSFSAQMSVS